MLASCSTGVIEAEVATPASLATCCVGGADARIAVEVTTPSTECTSAALSSSAGESAEPLPPIEKRKDAELAAGWR